MMVSAAARAAGTSGVEEGMALGVADVGVGLETPVIVAVAPQPARTTAAAADNRQRMTTVRGAAFALGRPVGREPGISMLVQLTRGSLVTVATRSEKGIVVGRRDFDPQSSGRCCPSETALSAKHLHLGSPEGSPLWMCLGFIEQSSAFNP
jgi:hypothetical protein